MTLLFDGESDEASTIDGGGGYALVAVEQGVDAGSSGLTYAVPAKLKDLSVGDRVVVPLGRGNKPVSGFVIERVDDTEVPKSKLKPVLERDPQGLSLTHELIELAQWVAGYYICPLGMVLQSMLPAAVKKGTGTVSKKWVKLSEPFVAGELDEIKLTKLQRQIVDTLRDGMEDDASDTDSHRKGLEAKVLAQRGGAKTLTPVNQLVSKGVLEQSKVSGVASDLDLRAQTLAASGAVKKVKALSPQQQAAMSKIEPNLQDGFGVHLLHGVTGSGKTEVYLRLIESLRKSNSEAGDDNEGGGVGGNAGGGGVIVLVPEIALTPQTVGRFVGRFDDVAVLHSGLTAAQRHAQWRRIQSGEARIVVGARSAVFAPLPSVDLIIVDEEHDTSYKQEQLPRYHARNVAIKRAQLNGATVVLGSATPSMESYANAVGYEDKPASYQLVSMSERVPGLKLPEVQLVDLREERRMRQSAGERQAGGIHLLSLRLERAIHETIYHDKAQVMLLLNRRGYANYIACPDQNCGWMMTCNHCDATMVYHLREPRHEPRHDSRNEQRQSQAQGRSRFSSSGEVFTRAGYLRCHHCQAEQLLPVGCPECGKKTTVFGLGTQRVEEELARKFKDIRLARMDSDTMKAASDYQETLDAFREGEIDVLLGTQMIAKGLDFPNVRLVGVISGDTSLNFPDFRSAERTFQMISQVAGRTGRGEQAGRVLVQTFNIDDPVIQWAAKHDYNQFASEELKIRHESGLPPVSRMARIVTRHLDLAKANSEALAIYDHLMAGNQALETDVFIRPPAPCAMAKIADHHRVQIEMTAPSAGRLQKLLTYLRNHHDVVSDRYHAIDVDPVALL